MEVKYDQHTGLVPAIIQDADTLKVLMLGYMNEASIAQTIDSGLVTFFSRSKNRLWTKGEESGNHLTLVSITNDCDDDTLLIKVLPKGPTCHKGTDTCWGEDNVKESYRFLGTLEAIISERHENPDDNSYTSSLFKKGINKIAQKVGEEAVELVIEAKDDDEDLFKGEAADLLFHYLVLLKAKGFGLDDIIKVLQTRHQKK